MDYHRALLKLKFEHELDLNDPDGLLEPVETNDRYKLLEDFKTLWTEDKEKWPKIYERFGQEIRQLESNWVQKPNGDPKVFSQVIRIRKDVMVQVLKRLIEEEKSRCK